MPSAASMYRSLDSGCSSMTALRTTSWWTSSFSRTRKSACLRSGVLASAWLISSSVVSLRTSPCSSSAGFFTTTALPPSIRVRNRHLQCRCQRLSFLRICSYTSRALVRGEPPSGPPAATRDRRAPGLLAAGASPESDVEVQGELRRRRPQPHRVQLALDLVVDPRLDDVLGEDVALEQELVVLLQLAQGLLERAGHLGDVLQLLGRQPIDVLVEWRAGVDRVLHAVQARHQHGREGQVRIAGRVGR